MRRVSLCYWRPNASNKDGCIALEIFEKDDRDLNWHVKLYASYRQESNDLFCSKDDDLKKYGDRYEILNLTPLKLHTNAMIEEYNSLKSRIKSSYWFNKRLKFLEDGSSIVMKILCAGGIEKYFPLHVQFGSVKHLFLLSSTSIFVSTSIGTVGLYAIVDNFQNKISIFLGAMAALILNGGGVLLLERFLEEKKLLGMNWEEGIIGIATSFGFALPFMLERLEFAESIGDAPLCAKLPIDVALLLSTCCTGPLLGYTASLILNLLGKIGHISTPANIYEKIKLIINLGQIPSRVQQALFKKHISFIPIILWGYLISYTIRKVGFSHIDSVLVGITGGIISGYGFLKLFFLPGWDKIIDDTLDNFYPLGKEGIEFIEKYNRSPARHAFVNMTTLLGMLGTIILLENQLSAPFRLISSFPGAMVGYLVGMLPFKLYKKIKNLVVSSTANDYQVLTAEPPLDPVAEDEGNFIKNSENHSQFNWGVNVLLPALIGLGLFFIYGNICSSSPTPRSVNWVEAAQWLTSVMGALLAFIVINRAKSLSHYCPKLFKVDKSSLEESILSSSAKDLAQNALA